jgi:hypothetical protein
MSIHVKPATPILASAQKFRQLFTMKSPIALALLAALLIGTGLGWILSSALNPGETSRSGSSPPMTLTTRNTPRDSSDTPAGSLPSSGTIEVEVKGGGLEAMKAYVREHRHRTPSIDHYREMILLSESLTADEFPEAMALVYEDSEQRYDQMTHSLFAAWLSKDTASAQAWFEENMSKGNDLNHLAHIFVNHLATIDSTAALQWLDQNKNAPNHDYLFSSVTAQMARSNPGEALRFIESRTLNHNALRSAYSSIYGVWAAEDPQAAMASAQSIERADLRQQIYQSIFYQWYREDPDASLAAIDGLSSSRDRIRAYQRIIWQLAEDDPAKAEQILERIPLGQERSQMVSNIANQMARDDPQKALEWVDRQQDMQGKNWALNNVLSQWARNDPLGALQYAFKLPNTSNKDNALGSAFNAYIDSEPEAAIQWVKSVDDEQMRSRLLRNQAYNLGRHMPEEALALGEYITPGTNQRSFYSNILNSWSNEQPDKAIEWFQSNITDPELTEYLGQTIAGNLVQHDPEKAIAFINQLPAPSQDQALSRVVSAMSNYDVSSAMEMADQIADEKIRTNAVSNVVSQWSRYDPEGVSRWLKQLPDGETRDQSINNFISQIRQHDPEAATIWASSIGNESQRKSSVQSAARNWMRQDPAAASAWIQATDILDAKEKGRLLD